jgi:hypothetical protein
MFSSKSATMRMVCAGGKLMISNRGASAVADPQIDGRGVAGEDDAVVMV